MIAEGSGVSQNGLLKISVPKSIMHHVFFEKQQVNFEQVNWSNQHY